MANGLQTIADILQGSVAGAAGPQQLSQFQQQLQNRASLAEQQRMQQAEMERQRQMTVFTDSKNALDLFNQGRFDLVEQLGMNCLQMAQNFPGVDFSDTERLTQLAGLASQGDTEAQDALRRELENNVKLGETIGVLDTEEVIDPRQATPGGQIIVKTPTGFEARDIGGFQVRSGRDAAKLQKGQTVLVDTGEGPAFATNVLDPVSGQMTTKVSPIKGELLSKLGETAEQKTQRKAGEAGKITAAKKRAERLQGFIDTGIESADSIPTAKRGLELLKQVKTGGINKVKNDFRRLLGIEGADEAELSANLGKNVLAQLRPVFGAQFTEREGARLEGIEAGFGKSTQGNIRLLNNALKIMDRAARRAIKAAEEQGDQFTADEIRKALDFTLDADAAPGNNVGRFQIEVVD